MSARMKGYCFVCVLLLLSLFFSIIIKTDVNNKPPGLESESKSELELEPWDEGLMVEEGLNSLTLTAADLDQILQEALKRDNESIIREGKIILKEGALGFELVGVLPKRLSSELPFLLRWVAGRETKIYIEITPKVQSEDIYLVITGASAGAIPIPLELLFAHMPPEWIGLVSYTDQGVSLNSVLGETARLQDMVITPDGIHVIYAGAVFD